MSNTLRYYLAHCSACISTFTTVRLNDSEAFAGSGDDKVSSESLFSRVFAFCRLATRSRHSFSSSGPSGCCPGVAFKSFGYMLQYVLGQLFLILPGKSGIRGILIALPFQRNGALSARGYSRRQVWRFTVFIVVCVPKRAFPCRGSKGEFQTLTREKGTHIITQQSQFVNTSPAHTRPPPSFRLPHPVVMSVLLIIFARKYA